MAVSRVDLFGEMAGKWCGFDCIEFSRLFAMIPWAALWLEGFMGDFFFFLFSLLTRIGSLVFSLFGIKLGIFRGFNDYTTGAYQMMKYISRAGF